MFTRKQLYIKYIIIGRCLKEGIQNLFEIIELMLEYKTLKEMNDKQCEVMISDIKKEVDYNLVNGEI